MSIGDGQDAWNVVGRGGILVTASDATDDPAGPFRSLFICAAQASLKVTHIDDSVVTYPGVAAGVFPFAVKRVWSTGTTDATKIVGSY